MKKYYRLLLCLLFCASFNNVGAQEPIKSGKKTIVINNAPALEIKKVTLIDENNDNVAETEEVCYFQLLIKNSGKSIAKTVNLESAVVAGLNNVLSFENSTYIGNIEIGEEKVIKIPFTTGISLNEGITTLRFIVQEANNYDSKPVEFDLKVQGKQVPLAVNWYYPPMPSTTVTEANYLIRACVLSSKQVVDVAIYQNNHLVADTRGFKPSKTSTCDCYIEQNIQLQKGKNDIKIIAKNTETEVTSEIRTLDYSETAYEYRTALVIGNSNYKTAPLRNPKNDAKAMAEALRDLSFDVIEIIDGNKETIRKGIRDFHTKLDENKGVGLFYYAGHGIQVKGENYLIPIDHDIQEEYEVPDRAIRINSLLAAMENSGTRMNIIILDACRDNPYARSTRSGFRGLAQIYAEGSGSIIAYATAPGSVASDGDGENGLYTQELLKAIKTPGLEIGMVFRRVRTHVKKLSGEKQLPWTNSSIEGEFYFIK